MSCINWTQIFVLLHGHLLANMNSMQNNENTKMNLRVGENGVWGRVSGKKL